MEEAFGRVNKGIEMMYRKKFLRKYFDQFKLNRVARQKTKVPKVKFAEEFYTRGLMRKCVKYWKVYSFGRSNKDAKKVLKHKVDRVVQLEMKKKDHQIAYLENLIREFEEQYKIELNKKALKRNDHDEVLKKSSTKLAAGAVQLSMSKLNEL